MTRRYIDTVTWQNMTLHKFGRLKLVVKMFDVAQFVGRLIRDILSFPKGNGRRVKTLQLADLSFNPKDCLLPGLESCLVQLCVGFAGLFVPVAMKVSEVAIERAAALLEWQDVENYICGHLWVTSPTASIGLSSHKFAAAWLPGGDG